MSVVSCSDEDRAHLARAVAMAQTVRGRTAPNPAVGCVLVDDGRVIAEGATAPAGGPHAEAAALAEAGHRARGATAYVSLEPCAHHGRTPPCADGLVAAGVTRVVFAHPDPNPVASGGASALLAGGVAVTGPDEVGGTFRDVVAAQLEGFLTHLRRGRPHVTLKLAQTADGQLTAPGNERWITGPAARAAVHRWRAAADAVLVGVGTVLADDPRLDVRHGPAVAPDPRPVVLDTHLRTPVEAAVVRRGALLFCGPEADPARRADLEEAGAEVASAPAGPDGGLALPATLAVLGARGIVDLFAEPGGTLAAALLADDLVDRLVLHVALGSGDGSPRQAVEVGRGWRTERLGGAGPDLIVQRVRVRDEDGEDR